MDGQELWCGQHGTGGEDKGLAGQGRSLGGVGTVGPQTTEENQASYVGVMQPPMLSSP